MFNEIKYNEIKIKKLIETKENYERNLKDIVKTLKTTKDEEKELIFYLTQEYVITINNIKLIEKEISNNYNKEINKIKGINNDKHINEKCSK